MTNAEDAPGAATVDIPLVVLALFFVSTLVGAARDNEHRLATDDRAATDGAQASGRWLSTDTPVEVRR